MKMPANSSYSKTKASTSNRDEKTRVSKRKDHNLEELKGNSKNGMKTVVSKATLSKSLTHSSNSSVKDLDVLSRPSKSLRKQEQISVISNSKTESKIKDKHINVASKSKVGEGPKQSIESKLSRSKGASSSSKVNDDSKLAISSKIMSSISSRKSSKEGINRSKNGVSKNNDTSKNPLLQGPVNNTTLRESKRSTKNQPSTGRQEKSNNITIKKDATSNLRSKNTVNDVKKLKSPIIKLPTAIEDDKFLSGRQEKSNNITIKKDATSNLRSKKTVNDVKKLKSPIIKLPSANEDDKLLSADSLSSGEIAPQSSQELQESVVIEHSECESKIVDLAHNSLETLESGISMTTTHDLSDAEVEESFSSRLVEVDELEMNDDLPPLSPAAHSVPFGGSINGNDIDLYDEKYFADDFEDYESDFENDDDDENVTDTNNESEDVDVEDSTYLNDTNGPNFAIEEVVKAIEAENNRMKDTDKILKTDVPEETVGDKTNISTKSILKTSRPKTGKAFVNFANVKERARVEKASEILKNRGQLLQEMIQLDTISIELFMQLPDSYETYISVFGSANCIQASVQTNEDNLSEYVQTDYPLALNKWTQQPVNVSSDIGDYSGVGGDITASDADPYDAYLAIASGTGRLTKFLDASSQVILQLLEENSGLDNETNLNNRDNMSLGFSKSCVTLGAGILSFLAGRACTLVSFCTSDSSLILTGHGLMNNSAEHHNLTTGQEEHFHLDSKESNITLNYTNVDYGALICLWSVHQPSFPKMILSCRSPPLVTCFSPKRPVIVMAGLQDGSLSAWDIRESNSSHPLIITTGKVEWRLRPPSFITACSPENVTEGSQIIALQTLLVDDETYHDGSFQIVSLSSCGQLTWWVLVQENHQSFWGNDPTVAAHLGAAPWSKIALSRATSLSLAESIAREEILGGFTYCYDMKLSQNDPNLLYVAIANGNVLHCSRHNVKIFPSSFNPSIGPGPEAVCISVCPHDPQYFLVGGSDGLIRLHSVTLPNPLTCWQASTNPAPIKNIKWSQSRPCVFYMLDYLGMFHIWDLSAGDIYPTISVDDGMLLEGKLMSFDLSSVPADDIQNVYAAFASDSGTVGIRSIAAQYLRKNDEEYNNELHRFKCYVNII